jgi:glutaredoxin
MLQEVACGIFLYSYLYIFLKVKKIFADCVYMRKLLFLLTMPTILLLSGCSWINGGNQEKLPAESKGGIIFFYGEGCPHCAKVEEFFKDNNVEDKVDFIKKEVYRNKSNASDLAARAKDCGLSTERIGIPFLWDGSKCLIGDEDIIDFFKQKISSH